MPSTMMASETVHACAAAFKACDDEIALTLGDPDSPAPSMIPPIADVIAAYADVYRDVAPYMLSVYTVLQVPYETCRRIAARYTRDEIIDALIGADPTAFTIEMSRFFGDPRRLLYGVVDAALDMYTEHHDVAMAEFLHGWAYGTRSRAVSSQYGALIRVVWKFDQLSNEHAMPLPDHEFPRMWPALLESLGIDRARKALHDAIDEIRPDLATVSPDMVERYSVAALSIEDMLAMLKAGTFSRETLDLLTDPESAALAATHLYSLLIVAGPRLQGTDTLVGLLEMVHDMYTDSSALRSPGYTYHAVYGAVVLAAAFIPFADAMRMIPIEDLYMVDDEGYEALYDSICVGIDDDVLSALFSGGAMANDIATYRSEFEALTAYDAHALDLLFLETPVFSPAEVGCLLMTCALSPSDMVHLRANGLTASEIRQVAQPM